MTMIKAGIVGGTGYTGVELLRLLAQHPQVELQGDHLAQGSRHAGGADVPEPAPQGRPRLHRAGRTRARAAATWCSSPRRTASRWPRRAPCSTSGARAIDLSADFRIQDLAEWERWYKLKHAAPELVREAVYGLPEMNRERIRGARLVANPGCYPTAVQLGFLPLVEAGVVDLDHLIADAKSGVSGAGRKAEVPLSFAEASDNFTAYDVPGHRHWPEIRQGLAQAAKREVGLVFTPHLTPMIRGIHATLYARMTKEADFQELFEKRYASEPFVDVMPAGSHPDTRSVRAANICRIAVHRPPESAAARIRWWCSR